MKKSKIWAYVLLIIIGGTLLSVGHFVFIGEELKSLSGLCVGIGAAAFVLGIGNFVGALVISKTENDEMTRKKNIEVNDERNTQIREKSAYQTLRVLQYTLYVFSLVLAFSNSPLYIVLIFAGIILLQCIALIIFNIYYDKKL